MSQAQIEGIIRNLVIAFGGVASAAGYLNAEFVVQLAGALATIAGIGWSIWSNSQHRLLTQTAELPVVKEITVKSNTVANDVPSAKVVSSWERK